MTINEFYEKHKRTTNLKIAQIDAIEHYGKTHNKIDYENMLDMIKHLNFINASENIDLQKCYESWR